jgi:plasmid stability protein
MPGMPRKKIRGKTVNAEGQVLRAVRLQLEEDLHDWLRIEAARHRMSMSAFSRELVIKAKADSEKTKPKGSAK